MLDATVRPALHAYLATIARNVDCECFRVGGVADHVHLAIRPGGSGNIALKEGELLIRTSERLFCLTQLKP